MTEIPAKAAARECSILIEKHGTFLVWPPDPSAGLPVLMGFHGYAETAENSMEVLQEISAGEAQLCCAVQALHLFYTKNNKIVGNWMTSRFREQAISDNVKFVDAVVESLRREHSCSERIIYFGFSQGGPMAYRAALLGQAAAAGLIILAGDMPPELAEKDMSRLPPVLLARGKNDTILPASQIEKDAKIIRSRGGICEEFLFEGGHHWTAEFAAKAREFISSLP